MKNICVLLIILTSALFKSQSVIVDIEETGLGLSQDYYRKDINNMLDPFQGTYIYTNGNNTFKIVLNKMIKQTDGYHFQDMIVGEYQYIENGVEKINTLSNLNVIYAHQSVNHGITGSSLLWNNSRLWKCPQCNPDEKRLGARIRDRISGRWGNFLIRKTVVNGQEVLQVKIYNISSEVINVDDPSTFNEPPFALPKGEFTMIKQ